MNIIDNFAIIQFKFIEVHVMNKVQSTVFKACLVGSACIIALASGLISSLVLFLFVGKVPGTATYLSPLQMGVVLAFIAMAVAYRNMAAHHKQHLKKRYSQWKQHLPKRRFTQA